MTKAVFPTAPAHVFNLVDQKHGLNEYGILGNTMNTLGKLKHESIYHSSSLVS